MKDMFKVLLYSCWLFCCASSFSYAAQEEMVQDARNFDGVIANIIDSGDQLANNYQPADAVMVSDGFSRLYFDQFESSGLEFMLSMYSETMLAEIELSFGELTELAIRGKEPHIIKEHWSELSGKLQAIPVGELNQESWIGNLTKSLIILLREGIEAILIIALLVAFLKRGGNGDKLWLVWSGAIVALLLSVLLAFVITYLLEGVGGKQREIMEGGILLISSGLLLYTSLWLLSQQDSKNWQKYLQSSIQTELNRSNQSVLFVMSFAAVFREGAETILFYQALMIDTQNYGDALWIGAGIASLLLVIFYFGVNRIMRLFRLDYFFKGTAVLLFMFATVFTGKGIMELQAGGAMSVTSIDNMGMIPTLGVFPTIEGLSAQALMIMLYLLSLIIYLRVKLIKDRVAS